MAKTKYPADKRRSVVIRARCTQSEMQTFEAAADEERMLLSDWVRTSLTKAAQKPPTKKPPKR